MHRTQNVQIMQDQYKAAIFIISGACVTLRTCSIDRCLHGKLICSYRWQENRWFFINSFSTPNVYTRHDESKAYRDYFNARQYRIVP